MKLQSRKYRVLFIFIGITSILSGQETIKTSSSWLNAELAYEWNKRLEIELSQSTRFGSFYDAFAVSNTTIEAGYEISDWLKILPAYRYIFRERKRRQFHRFQLSLQARKKIGNLKLTWRTRLEQRNAIKRDDKVTRIRNKFSTSYPIKNLKLEPKAFIEYWYSYDPEIQNFSKYRVGIGLDYDVHKQGTIKIGFRYDHDLNQAEIEKENIFLLGYTHKFKRKK